MKDFKITLKNGYKIFDYSFYSRYVEGYGETPGDALKSFLTLHVRTSK